jgi:hypothetical protein
VGAFDFITIAVGLLVHAIAWWFSVDVARATTSSGVTRP